MRQPKPEARTIVATAAFLALGNLMAMAEAVTIAAMTVSHQVTPGVDYDFIPNGMTPYAP